MARAETQPGYKGLIVYIGDNAAPIVYTAPCAFPTQAIELEKQMTEEANPDCDDQSQPSIIERLVESKDFRITGEGLVASQSMDTWDDAFESADPVPIRADLVKVDGAIIRREGLMHLQSLSYNRPSDKEKVRFNVTLVAAGGYTVEKVAAPI